MAVKSYRDLVVWQRSMELVVEVYRRTDRLPARETYGLASQLRRAVTSIPINLAEGHGRARTREYLCYIGIARGSLTEVETELEIAQRLGFVDAGDLAGCTQLMEQVGRMLTRLYQSLERRLAKRDDRLRRAPSSQLPAPSP